MSPAIRTSNNLDLSDTVRVTEDNTDLRRSCALLCELADLVDNLVGCRLQPRWRLTGIGDGARRNALAVTVHATHIGGIGSKTS